MKELMSYEEYEGGDFETPYYFEIEESDKLFSYFGESHSRNPEHKQWQDVIDAWNSFVERTEDKPRTAFIEGGTRPVVEDEDTAIRKHGGPGLVTHLAAKEDISVFSPEPSSENERNMLTEKYTKEEVEYMYFARTVLQWNRFVDAPDFEEYISKYLNEDENESGWDDFDFSLQHMKAVHATFFDTEFDKEDREFFYTIINPLNEKTKVNHISRTLSKFRDSYIVGEVVEHWKSGESLFGVYGQTHVVMQEPALQGRLQ